MVVDLRKKCSYNKSDGKFEKPRKKYTPRLCRIDGGEIGNTV